VSAVVRIGEACRNCRRTLFTEVAGVEETIEDHLLRVFAPEDDKGALRQEGLS
jgi:hypothetical protein